MVLSIRAKLMKLLRGQNDHRTSGFSFNAIRSSTETLSVHCGNMPKHELKGEVDCLPYHHRSNDDSWLSRRLFHFVFLGKMM